MNELEAVTLPKNSLVSRVATKAHKIEKARQLIELSVRQRNAIDLIVMGASDKDTAEKVGVVRETITRWRLYHPAFRAELNRTRQAIWGASSDRLRDLLQQSMDVLQDILNDPEHPRRADIALSLVQDSGLFVELGKIGDATLRTAVEKASCEIDAGQFTDHSWLSDCRFNKIMAHFEGADSE